MTPFRPEAALAAALLVAGCAGADAPLRREVDALRVELAAARQENQELRRKVEGLAARMDLVTARLTRAGDPRPEPPAEAPTAAPPAAAALVPDGLAVVRVEPPRRRAPPVPTAVPIVEPDGTRLAALGRRSGRELAAEAEGELRSARRLTGLALAHGLEDFVARYPHHPQADDALVEAAAAYAAAGRGDAACKVARRAAEEYPAGDALSDALWRLAGCESRRGDADAEKKVLSRLVTEFPSTPAARRAGERLAAISGQAGAPPADGPARSGP